MRSVPENQDPAITHAVIDTGLHQASSAAVLHIGHFFRSIEIAALARIHLKPRQMFERCVDFLVQHRFQVPRSGVLVELIRSGLQTRKVGLIALMDVHPTAWFSSGVQRVRDCTSGRCPQACRGSESRARGSPGPMNVEIVDYHREGENDMEVRKQGGPALDDPDRLLAIPTPFKDPEPWQAKQVSLGFGRPLHGNDQAKRLEMRRQKLQARNHNVPIRVA